ncbi:chemosensory protein 8 precursor [Tribolium castaneum]|uniref:Chemosensory protein 16 n=1 Tax=Tribolium castaneum TaxID=7070 RepID=Q0MRL5_TRICA|nr:chemosensory protein 8 precursor [Tribolium castaneum]ABH88181.1 chemosensory protein 8 [Tribolium castaneum]EFA07567.1 chemosensory protein 16 [Tribolium castaneum]|eukprot:NP_001039290.1 chemosensory protein 8 precursor [Tribolium castaneum]
MPLVKSLVVVVLLIGVVYQVQGQLGLAGNNYIEKQLLCALDKAPCDALGNQIKGALPEIIGKNCERCDSRQVANARRIARYVQTKHPDVWNALVKKYSV